jgi:flagellar basal-body rod protein FlgB
MDTTTVRSDKNDLLNKLLDVAVLRHQVIAHNVANVNTPGYHRLEVSFEDQLEQVLHSGGNVKQVQPQVHEATGGNMRADGNNVDIDDEMGLMTKNNLLYSACTQLLNHHLGQQRSAISGH